MLKADRKARPGRMNLVSEPVRFITQKLILSGKDRQSLRLTEDIGLAQHWLADGAPVADVMTMLESRHRFNLSPADCRALAVEILCAAQHISQSNTDVDPNLKESHHAAA